MRALFDNEPLKQAILSENVNVIKKTLTRNALTQSIFDDGFSNAINFAVLNKKWIAVHLIIDLFPNSGEADLFNYRSAFIQSIRENQYTIAIKLVENNPPIVEVSDLGFLNNHYPLLAPVIKAHLSRWKDSAFLNKLQYNPMQRIMSNGGNEEKELLAKLSCYYIQSCPPGMLRYFDDFSGMSSCNPSLVENAKLWASHRSH